MEIEPIDNLEQWGLSETKNEPPPAEVVDRVLAMPEVERDFPDVYAEALELKKQRKAEQ